MVVVCYPDLVVFVLSGLSVPFFFFVMHFSVRFLIMPFCLKHDCI